MGSSPGKTDLRQGAADQGHPWRAGAVGLGEHPSPDQGDAHRLEVARSDEAHPGLGRLVGSRRRAALDREGEHVVRAAQGQGEAGARGLDPGDRPQALGEALVERDLGRVVRIARLRKREPQGHDSRRLEARGDPLEPDERPDQQPRAHQQDQRRRHLDEHQEVAHQPGSAARRLAAATLAERALEVALRRMEGRKETEDQAGDECEAEGEAQDRPVETDLAGAGDAVGAHGHQHPRARDPEGEPQQAAGEAEHEALGQELAHQAAARGAQGSADRDLALARRHAGEQEIGHVGTRDQQDHAHGHHENQQGRPNGLDHPVLEQHEVHAPSRVVVRVLLLEPLGDAGDLRLRALQGHPVREPADDAEVVGTPLLGIDLHGERHPGLGVAVREVEALGGDADHGVRLAVEGQPPADDPGVGAEAALPEAVGEHHDVPGTRPVLLRAEAPPEGRRPAQDPEEPGRDLRALDPLGLDAGRGQAQVGAGEGGHAGERTALRPPVREVGRRGGEAREAGRGVAVDQQRQAVGVRIGQRPQQDAVDDAEDRRVGADPQGQGDEGGGGQRRGAGEAPEGDPQVFEQGLHRRVSSSPPNARARARFQEGANAGRPTRPARLPRARSLP